MTIRTVILSSLICLALLPLISHAQVDYISLHEIESSARQPLSVKLNIVQIHKESQLKFVLVNQNVVTALDYQPLNNFMLRLKSPHYIIGKASILLYELEQNAWQQTHSVDISNSLIATEIDKKAIVKATEIATQCQLIREPKETLWSVASRYKNKWNVDVYSAMVVIYRTNLNKFAKQHIGKLNSNVELTCPSKKTITMLGDKAEMKAEFNKLNRR